MTKIPNPSIIRGLEACPLGTVLEHPMDPEMVVTKTHEKGRVWTDRWGSRATTYGVYSLGFFASDFGVEAVA